MSSMVVRGLTIQKRSTVSPSCLVVVTKARPSAISFSLQAAYCAGLHPGRRNTQIDRYCLTTISSLGVFLDHAGGFLRHIDRFFYRLGVGFGSVGRETKPEWQPAGATRKVMRVIRGVPHAVIENFEIIAFLLMGAASCRRVPIDQCAAIEGAQTATCEDPR